MHHWARHFCIPRNEYIYLTIYCVGTGGRQTSFTTNITQTVENIIFVNKQRIRAHMTGTKKKRMKERKKNFPTTRRAKNNRSWPHAVVVVSTGGQRSLAESDVAHIFRTKVHKFMCEEARNARHVKRMYVLYKSRLAIELPADGLHRLGKLFLNCNRRLLIIFVHSLFHICISIKFNYAPEGQW